VLQAWEPDTNGHTYQLFVSRGIPPRIDATARFPPEPTLDSSNRRTNRSRGPSRSHRARHRGHGFRVPRCERCRRAGQGSLLPRQCGRSFLTAGLRTRSRRNPVGPVAKAGWQSERSQQAPVAMTSDNVRTGDHPDGTSHLLKRRHRGQSRCRPLRDGCARVSPSSAAFAPPLHHRSELRSVVLPTGTAPSHDGLGRSGPRGREAQSGQRTRLGATPAPRHAEGITEGVAAHCVMKTVFPIIQSHTRARARSERDHAKAQQVELRVWKRTPYSPHVHAGEPAALSGR
jgi:hypothetical protein